MFSLSKILVLPALLSALAVSALPSERSDDTVVPPAFKASPTVPQASIPSLTRDQAAAAVIAAAPSKGAILAAAAKEEMVLTPFGMRPASRVFTVPEGGQIVHVGDDIHLLDADGNVVHTSTPGDSVPRLPEATGWVAYASWYNSGSTPIQDLITSWTVPSNPPNYDGQTLFFFNSIEPASFNAIVQPVLQYGPSYAGGGEYWSVASWYLVGSNTYVSTLSQVSAGQGLQGVISLTGSSGSSFNYDCYFANIGSSQLTVSNAEQLVWATETLETYSTTGPSDYPDGAVQFTNIYLWLQDNTYPSISWSSQSDDADGIITTINTDGAYNAAITINFPA